MEKRELKKGDLLQYRPDHEPYGGQLVMVEEPKIFGCQGVLFTDQDYIGLTRYQGRAFVRPKFEDVELVGRLEWVWEDENE